MSSGRTGEETVTRLLSSKEKGELLTLFHRNPGLMDDAEGVARRIGRTASVIKGDLDDLVAMGILGTLEVGSARVIFLDRAKDRQTLGEVADHLRGMGKN